MEKYLLTFQHSLGPWFIFIHSQSTHSDPICESLFLSPRWVSLSSQRTDRAISTSSLAPFLRLLVQSLGLHKAVLSAFTTWTATSLEDSQTHNLIPNHPLTKHTYSFTFLPQGVIKAYFPQLQYVPVTNLLNYFQVFILSLPKDLTFVIFLLNTEAWFTWK